MDFVTWLDAERGRSMRLAADRGVTKGAITQWRKFGVPMGHWAGVVAFAGGELSLQDLVAHAMAAKARAQEPARAAA